MSGTIAKPRLGAIAAFVLTLGLGVTPQAKAQIGSERYSAIVVDARSGNPLIAANPDEQRYPASLTKMMTVYLAFEALRDGRTSLSSPVQVSVNAATKAPSRLGLTPGMSLTVEEAVLALVTKSANDAAAALGEHLGGTEERFAQMMTLKARALGMSRTTFRNASGLPDLDQVTTARDMALLGRRLMQDFPDRFSYFSTPHFVFRGRTHWNHNRLLQEYDGADGIKTGYVNDSGFNLVASAQREGVRLVAAVFGGSTGRERDRHMMALLDQGFGQMGVSAVARRHEAGPLMARAAVPGVLARARAATMRTALAAAQPRTARAVQVSSRATAATTRAAAAEKPARASTGRPGLLRMASTSRASALRIEQGDTDRGAIGQRGKRLAIAAAPTPKVTRVAASQPPRKR